MFPLIYLLTPLPPKEREREREDKKEAKANVQDEELVYTVFTELSSSGTDNTFYTEDRPAKGKEEKKGEKATKKQWV